MKKKNLLFTILSICLFMFPLFTKANTMGPMAWVSTTKTLVGGTVTYVFDTTNEPIFSIQIKYDAKILEYIPSNNDYYTYKIGDGIVTISRSGNQEQLVLETFLTVAEFKVLAIPNGGKLRVNADIILPESSTHTFELEKINTLDVTITDETKECPKCENKECPSCEVKEDPDTSVDDKTNVEDTTDLVKDDSKLSAEKTTNSSNGIKDVLLYATIGSNVLLAGAVVVLILRNRKKKSSTQNNNL